MKIFNLGKQLMYYGFFGFLATIVDYGLFLLLYYFNVHYLLASLISAIIGSVVNFNLNKKITFKDKSNRIVKQFALYIIGVIIYLGLKTLVLYVLTAVFGINPVVSKLLSFGVVFPFNFLMNKYVIFNEALY